MVEEKPDLATITSKGQITIPSRVRQKFGLDEGDKLVVMPTKYGIVLKKIELPTVEEFEEMVKEHQEKVALSLEDVQKIVHEYRGVKG